MPDLAERLREAQEGNRLALARLLTDLEDGTLDASDRGAVFAAGHDAHLVGITGPAGSGKSTLVDALIRGWRAQGRRVGVIAVDPSSPLTGGAIMGDRIRMMDHVGDDGVFVRSMASRGALGGLAATTWLTAAALDAGGYDPVLIETVGAGQSEVEIATLAETTVVVEVPEMGDEVQAIKAGLLEIADLVVVNKSDRPGADRAARQLKAMLSTAGGRMARPAPPVMLTSATTGEGVEALREAVDAHRRQRTPERDKARAAELLRRALASRAHERALSAPGWVEAVAAVAERREDPLQPRIGCSNDVPFARHGAGTLGPMSLERVYVLGAGLMGHGIAQVSAAAGKQVTIADRTEDLAVAGRQRIAGNLARLVEKGRLAQDEADATLRRIATSVGVDAVAGHDLVIEAVFEDEAIKRESWTAVTDAADPDAIFASNTSSISITALATATDRPDRFIGLHFFSPVPVMKLIEIIRGLETSDQTEQACRAFAVELGKTVITSKDYPGFLVNRMLGPFINEAVFALAEGTGTAEEIDTGARLGLNHPMGPLELADFVGVDVMLNVMDVLYRGFGDPKFRAAPLLRQMVAAGHLGRKTGRGFYRYDEQGNKIG